MTNTPNSNRCFLCFRPIADCHCDEIPSIDNQTSVLILQHLRERSHPFNTARMVNQALQQCVLIADYTGPLADRRLPLAPGAGVLYPTEGAELIGPDTQLSQLVILDGTWHQAKTMMRDIPALQQLPRYRLNPAQPGQYRIRREPDAISLSTVEATVAALQTLEPDTPGWDALLKAFDSMVARQLKHPKATNGWRKNTKRSGGGHSIPRLLTQDHDRLVVVYGEAAFARNAKKSTPRSPVFWVAQRVGTGEQFVAPINAGSPLTPEFIRLLELKAEHFAAALSPDEFCQAWSEFLRPHDTLVAYNPSTLRLLRCIGADTPKCIPLKPIRWNNDHQYSQLSDLLKGEQIEPPPPSLPGRAGQRLANALAVVNRLATMESADTRPAKAIAPH